ncbi:hypothetical protein BCR35DRAFT_221271 [Leucosporidium creatinivorum]|uniref:Uncharacterized protein n=1 Tax=Leucosporidium creatinivorum TaxID=106004 RepID=A0A1Y2D8F2_9BASI|nr:hypothetical protein BCR35DRAFT_221271 [Leucosporidium creatinivorum]
MACSLSSFCTTSRPLPALLQVACSLPPSSPLQTSQELEARGEPLSRDATPRGMSCTSSVCILLVREKRDSPVALFTSAASPVASCSWATSSTRRWGSEARGDDSWATTGVGKERRREKRRPPRATREL